MPGYTPIPEKDIPWEDEKAAGLRIARLSGNGVTMTLVDIKKGVSYPSHSHSIGSYMYVVKGAVEVDGHTLPAGSAGKCEPGYGHYPTVALEDSLYVVCRDAEDEIAYETTP